MSEPGTEYIIAAHDTGVSDHNLRRWAAHNGCTVRTLAGEPYVIVPAALCHEAQQIERRFRDFVRLRAMVAEASRKAGGGQ